VKKLEGKVAIVTGGGTGIGRSVSESFAREGALVAVNYNTSRDAAEETVRHIAASGGRAVAVQASVSDDNDVRAMVTGVEHQFGRIDILVNNAGWSTRVPHDQMEALTDEIWDRTLNTNLRGVFYCVRAAAPFLRKQSGASIVNIASVAGLSGMGSSMVYAASKGALITMTKSMARALAPDIRVNAVAPGFVRTRFANWPQSAFDEGQSQTPLGKLASTDDIAATVLFLAADAPVTTGEIIVVDGGTTVLGPRFRKHV
jgi:3-oxoacyl-[acyl-carrier protein] reductase